MYLVFSLAIHMNAGACIKFCVMLATQHSEIKHGLSKLEVYYCVHSTLCGH